MRPAEPTYTLEKKLSEFSSDQRNLILENIFTLQLTEGCSLGCFDCGAGALVGVRRYIPFVSLERFFHENASALKNLDVLYLASDPFDYNFEGKSYIDVHRLMAQTTGHKAYVSTSAPISTEEMILGFIFNDNSLELGRHGLQVPFIRKFNLMKSNYSRLQKAFSGMKGFREEDQLKTSKFRIRRDGSIKIKDPGLREKINGSALYLYGESKGSVIYMIETGIGYVCSQGNPVTFQDAIEHLKFYTESHSPSHFMVFSDFYSMQLSHGGLHNRLLGEHFADNLSSEGIICAHGVILKPGGVYNIQAVKPSSEHPLGFIESEIKPENFEVIPHCHNYCQGRDIGDAFYKLGERRYVQSDLASSGLKDIIESMSLAELQLAIVSAYPHQ
jgi:hypothetical protein